MNKNKTWLPPNAESANIPKRGSRRLKHNGPIVFLQYLVRVGPLSIWGGGFGACVVFTREDHDAKKTLEVIGEALGHVTMSKSSRSIGIHGRLSLMLAITAVWISWPMGNSRPLEVTAHWLPWGNSPLHSSLEILFSYLFSRWGECFLKMETQLWH